MCPLPALRPFLGAELGRTGSINRPSKRASVSSLPNKVEGRQGPTTTTMRFSAYDDIHQVSSIVPQSITGSSAVDGVAVDTEGYDNAKLHVYAAEASGSPSAASLTVTLQESPDNNSDWTNALDNTGTVIGFTLSGLNAAAGVNAARIEGLNLNRKRYLRIVVTPSFTGGSSPAILAYGEIVFGGGVQQLPVTTTSSNT